MIIAMCMYTKMKQLRIFLLYYRLPKYSNSRLEQTNTLLLTHHKGKAAVGQNYQKGTHTDDWNGYTSNLVGMINRNTGRNKAS